MFIHEVSPTQSKRIYIHIDVVYQLLMVMACSIYMYVVYICVCMYVFRRPHSNNIFWWWYAAISVGSGAPLTLPTNRTVTCTHLTINSFFSFYSLQLIKTILCKVFFFGLVLLAHKSRVRFHSYEQSKIIYWISLVI